MIVKEWHSPTRYYRLEISKDLFGFWVMTRIWRGRFSKKGSSLTISTESEKDVETWIHTIEKQRIRKGYKPIS